MCQSALISENLLIAQLIIPKEWLEQEREPALSLQRQWLSSDENQRYQELHQSSDRLRMVAGRFVLRQCLLEFYGLSQAPFHYGENNKPLLLQSTAERGTPTLPLDVNLSHDRQHVLAAFSTQGAVGIDVASQLDFNSWTEFALDYLTADEVAWVQDVPAADQPLRALRFWTLKEAILKSVGHGLEIDPREIALLPGASCPIRVLPRQLPPASSFALYEWQIDTQTFAALAFLAAPGASSSAGVSASAPNLRFVQMSAKPLMPVCWGKG